MCPLRRAAGNLVNQFHFLELRAVCISTNKSSDHLAIALLHFIIARIHSHRSQLPRSSSRIAQRVRE